MNKDFFCGFRPLEAACLGIDSGATFVLSFDRRARTSQWRNRMAHKSAGNDMQTATVSNWIGLIEARAACRRVGL
jgi:hypothetical protein